MALHGSLIVSNPRKEEVQAKLEKAIGEAVKVEKSTSKLSLLLHHVHPLCMHFFKTHIFCAGVRLEDSKALARISRQTPLPPLRRIHLQCT